VVELLEQEVHDDHRLFVREAVFAQDLQQRQRLRVFGAKEPRADRCPELVDALLQVGRVVGRRVQAAPTRLLEQQVATTQVVVVQHAQVEQQFALAAVARSVVRPLLGAPSADDFLAHRMQRHVRKPEPRFQHICPKRLVGGHAH